LIYHKSINLNSFCNR